MVLRSEAGHERRGLFTGCRLFLKVKEGSSPIRKFRRTTEDEGCERQTFVVDLLIMGLRSEMLVHPADEVDLLLRGTVDPCDLAACAEKDKGRRCHDIEAPGHCGLRLDVHLE